MFFGFEASTAFPRRGDFWAYLPITLAEGKKERNAAASWDFADLAYIPTVNTYPQAVLEPFVQRLIEEVGWVSGSKLNMVGRFGAPMAGAHRGNVPQTFSAYFDRHATGVLEEKRQATPHLNMAVANDWKLMRDIPMTSAYTFRGDKRTPQEVEAADGMHPPSSRKDDAYISQVYPSFRDYVSDKYGMDVSEQDFVRLFKKTFPREEDQLKFSFYSQWRSRHEREKMHLGRMIVSEELKGYISTTKAVTLAKASAGKSGFVYVMLVRSGYVIPPREQHPWTMEFNEQEIASPTAIPWADIVGYREMQGVKFHPQRPLYLRKSFCGSENAAFAHCYYLLSGGRQPEPFDVETFKAL